MIYYFSLGLGFIVLLALSAIAVCYGVDKLERMDGLSWLDTRVARFIIFTVIASALILFITALGYGVHITHFGDVNEVVRENR